MSGRSTWRRVARGVLVAVLVALAGYAALYAGLSVLFWIARMAMGEF